MLRDFILASAHHLLLFGLVAMLAVQSALLSRPLDTGALRRLVGIDRGYGASEDQVMHTDCFDDEGEDHR